jgi:D-sedoheptulose 7-phosphate isomerase
LLENTIKKLLKKTIIEKNSILQKLLFEEKKITKLVRKFSDNLQNGGKLIFCGNGGSAADAQHLATEYLVRLRPSKNRCAIPSISLTLDSTYLTACGNDYGFENIFSRAISGLGNKNDILIAISTSGRSKNIIKVLQKAREMGIYSFALLGSGGGDAKKYCQEKIIVKSKNVARIQETHIFLGHFILENLEEELFIKKIIK